MRTLLVSFLLVFLLTTFCFATIVPVPGPFGPTIQAAIVGAVNGDTVVVANGIYFENIDFLGKDIKVFSNFYLTNNTNDILTTVINGGGLNSVVSFITQEPPTAEIRGFTITNGIGATTGPYLGNGAGVRIILNSHPTVAFCYLTGNFAQMDGGGIFIADGCTANINDCEIDNNSALRGGGVFSMTSMSVFMRDSIFVNNADLGAGMFFTFEDMATIDSSQVNNNSANFDGGGVFCEMAQPIFHQSRIFDNNANGMGGGMAILGSIDVHVDECEIYWNSATTGGGVYGAFSSVFLNVDLIHDNWAGGGGGGIFYDNVNGVVFDNTLYGNSTPGSGGGINLLVCPNMVITNTIISYSWSGDGIYFDAGSNNTTVTFCDFFANTGLDYNGPAIPPGLGVPYAVNAQGHPCDMFANIFAPPMFVNPAVRDFNLLAGSQVIDSGDPNIGMDPDYTINDIGIKYFNQPPGNVSITLFPQNVPVFIPLAGGSLQFYAQLTNHTAVAQTFDIWTEAVLPSGNVYGPLLQLFNFTLNAGASIYPGPLNQNVPGSAPAGNYIYVAKIGTYPNTVNASSSFYFYKSPVLNMDEIQTYSDWEISGWENAGIAVENASDPIPTEYRIDSVYPNPFNSSTQIRIALPEKSELTVKVFNELGQEVAVLARGNFTAGYQSIVFNARDLSSGIYFIQATVPGKMKQLEKLILLK